MTSRGGQQLQGSKFHTLDDRKGLALSGLVACGPVSNKKINSGVKILDAFRFIFLGGVHISARAPKVVPDDVSP